MQCNGLYCWIFHQHNIVYMIFKLTHRTVLSLKLTQIKVVHGIFLKAMIKTSTHVSEVPYCSCKLVHAIISASELK